MRVEDIFERIVGRKPAMKKEEGRGESEKARAKGGSEVNEFSKNNNEPIK